MSLTQHFEKIFIGISIIILFVSSYFFGLTAGIAMFGAFFSICTFLDRKLQSNPQIQLVLRRDSSEDNVIICKIKNIGSKAVYIQDVGFQTGKGKKISSGLKPIDSTSFTYNLPVILKPGFGYEFRETSNALLEKLELSKNSHSCEVQAYLIDSIDKKFESKSIKL